MPALVLILSLFTLPPAESRSELVLIMHERFAYATMMRTALIHGYLERALRYAGLLEDALTEGDPDAIRKLARETARAETVAEAAAGIARTAEACGACHQENKVMPVFLGQEAAPWGKNLVARMGRHIWAADRMWQGLIAHSEPSWQRGANALGNDPFLTPVDEMRIPRARIEIVQSIAAEAGQARSWPKRAEVYGRFLAECAECHRTYAR